MEPGWQKPGRTSGWVPAAPTTTTLPEAFGADGDGGREALFAAQWSLAVSERTVSSNGGSGNALHVLGSSSGSCGLQRGHENLSFDKGLRRTGRHMTPNEDVQCRSPTSSRGSLITILPPQPKILEQKQQLIELANAGPVVGVLLCDEVCIVVRRLRPRRCLRRRPGQAPSDDCPGLRGEPKRALSAVHRCHRHHQGAVATAARCQRPQEGVGGLWQARVAVHR